MIRLAPGANPKNALQMVTDAATKLANVLGSGTAFDQYNKYLEWASQQGNVLSYQLHADELDRIITTRRYWSLLSLDTTTIQFTTLAELVRGEVTQRALNLEEAKKRLTADLARWDHGEAVAVVLDTNVWLKHFEDPIKDIDWNSLLDERQGVPLVLSVPMKVVDELDRHKRSRENAPKGGRPLRRRAGLALRYLESHAAAPGERTVLQEGRMSTRPATSSIYLSILEQPLNQPQIPDADLEIIDRSLAIQPYAKDVRLVTTDFGMIFRAGQAGLKTTRVRDYEAELNKDDL